jgi:hypothetical protein
MSATSMAEMKRNVATSLTEAEFRIEENTGSSPNVVRLQGVLVGTAPRAGETVELEEGRFKVIEVRHRFSGSPLKHVVVVTVEKPQPTAIQ